MDQTAAVPLPGDSGMGTTSIPQRKRWSRSVQRRKRKKQAPEEVNQVKGTECILSFALISARVEGRLTYLRRGEQTGHMQSIQGSAWSV